MDYGYKKGKCEELGQRLAYLCVPQHDHSDQYNIYMNAQGFIMVNFIHLRK